MNKKKSYAPPHSEVFHIEPHCSLLHTSFEDNNGNGHNTADDDEVLNAKQTWFDNDNNEEFND